MIPLMLAHRARIGGLCVIMCSYNAKLMTEKYLAFISCALLQLLLQLPRFPRDAHPIKKVHGFNFTTIASREVGGIVSIFPELAA